MMKYIISIVLISLCVVNGDNVGWLKQFDDNPTEFHDIPLEWENGRRTNIPSWLYGTYIRNGPAQATFGSEKKHLSHYLDGFAKLHSFKFDGQNVLFSGKMVQSTTYKDSVENGELVPQFLLGFFEDPEEEWTMSEEMSILQKSQEQFNGKMEHNMYDNFNPGVWRMGSIENPIYVTTTDFPYIQRFDIGTLDTLELMKPKFGSDSLTGVTHWQREPGTDNSIYPLGKRGHMWHPHSVEVQRFKPEDIDFSNPEVITSFNLKKTSMQHSFSITENHAIFMYSPVTMDAAISCLAKNAFHGMGCVRVLENELTDVYIVNLKTKEVTEIQAEALFSMHHINAYETSDGAEIIVDLQPTNDLALEEYPLVDKMKNPPEVSTSNDTSTCGVHEVTRYRINLQTKEITGSTFPNHLQNTAEEFATKGRFINKFDMGVINEAYRGKEYCIIYGWSAFDYSRTALVKKNVCDSTQDKVRYIENQYASEMYFIANPEGSSEDDGVLVSVHFDGPKEQSYLLVLDAKTFEEIDRSYLPHNIPFPLSHGMHFPEATWTI